VQSGQQVCCAGIETVFQLWRRFQHPRENGVAQVFEQQQPGVDVLRDDRRGAETEPGKVLCDTDEGAHILTPFGRGVHQHGPLPVGAVGQPQVTAVGRVARQRRNGGI